MAFFSMAFSSRVNLNYSLRLEPPDIAGVFPIIVSKQYDLLWIKQSVPRQLTAVFNLTDEILDADSRRSETLTMSWLARSIANTLKLDDHDDDDVSALNEDDSKKSSINSKNPENQQNLNDDSLQSSPTSPPRGVKDDISELTKSLTRQFWGVASFLAPPPQSAEPYMPDDKLGSGSAGDQLDSDQVGIVGIRNDFVEIGGKFRSGISMLSNNIAVSEITKMASNFLQLGSESEEEDGKGNRNSSGGAVGVTDEVVSFARDIAMHPETWLDFPLPENGDDDDDFDMSDAQQEHALAVEHLAPRLAALRIELCPGYMSESCFWKIYFVLLHPRLDKKDAELLSTTQIVKARALLSQELRNRTKPKLQDWSGEGTVDVKDSSNNQNEESLFVPSKTDQHNLPEKYTESATSTAAAESETEKHPVMSTEIPIVDKSVIEEKCVVQIKDQNAVLDSYNVLVNKDEDDADDWLKEESSEVGGASSATIPIENEEDVSFSDLEEDDIDVPASFKKISYSSDKDTRDWVQLRKSCADSSESTESGTASKKVTLNHPVSKESNDWLDIDDIDVV
ncbi:hypothetical protein ACH5RR_011563 [Cinchona calisaya]|uniref:BSD domain-containing protein n=1 Tax=Cinchona calisaya TaxID=153742 RepID=A0ABD3A8U9_9GENT